MLLFKLVVILYLISSTSALLNTQLVIDFLKFKSLQLTCVFNCFSRPEQVTFSKHLMKEGIRIMGSTINHHNSSLKFVKEKLINHIGIIVDNECNNVEDLLEQAGKMRLFHFMQHWLVITSNNNIYNEFKNLHFHINADFIVAIPNRDNLVNGYEISEIWNIFDVYNPAHHRGGKLKIINYGTYNRSNGFIVDKRNKYERRKNMNEVTFKSTVVVREDINQSLEDYLTINNSRGIDAFNKCHCRFMYHCGAYFNFEQVVSMKKAHSWGYNKTKDGQHYGGILEYLQKKEVDYVCTGLWYVKDRLSFVSHAPGIWTFTGKFMFRRPSQKMFVEKFLHPMENSVWLVTLGILALIIVSLRFTQATEPKLANRPKESLDSSWSILFVITLGALFQQDFFFNSKLFGGRIVIMCVLLFCLIFYQFYSGSIVSSLLVEPSNKIKTGKDLLESPLRIATDDTPYFVNYYKNTTNPVDKSLYYNKILKGKGNQPNHYKPAEGLELVKNGGVAYQVEETEAYEIIKSTFPDKAICDLGEVLVFPKRLLTTGVQKDSPYRDMFTHCTTYLIEVGIGDYLKKLFGSSKPECLQGAIELTISVGLAEIFPAIALLGMGMLTSFITLLLEIYMKRRHTRIKHNVN